MGQKWGGQEYARVLFAYLSSIVHGVAIPLQQHCAWCRRPYLSSSQHTTLTLVCPARQYDQREAAYGGPPDEHTLWLWKDADWRRWERDEPWDWDAEKRR